MNTYKKEKINNKKEIDNKRLLSDIVSLKNEIKAKDKLFKNLQLEDDNSWMKYLSFFDRRKLKKSPEVCFHIIMLFPNSSKKELIVKGDRRGFYYRGRWYIINKDKAWNDISRKTFTLIYSFEYSDPMDNAILYKGKEVFGQIKSDTSEEVMNQEYIRVLATANQLNKYLKVNLFLTAFTTFFTVVLMMILFVMMRNLDKILKVVHVG